MVNKLSKSIVVSEKTHERLVRRKKYSRQTMDEIITELMDSEIVGGKK